MARPEFAAGMPRLVTLAAVAVVTLSLYLGREVLIPLALAVLFSFLLAPLVTRLERVGLGRIPAVIVITVFTFAAVGATAFFVTRQLIDLAEALPAHRDNIRRRIETLRGHPSALTKAAESIQQISQEIASSQPASAPASAPVTLVGPPEKVPQPPAHAAAPMPVTLVEPTPSPIDTARDTLGPLMAPLGTAAVVIIVVVFILIQREELRDRLIFLLGRGHIHLTTQALDDASRRISRYLLMQLIINVTYGVPVAVAMYFLELPNPLVWGLLATLLRYLPYIGPWIAALLPITLSLTIHSDWWHPIAVISVFILLELLSNNVMEPWLYGSSTGLSSVAVIVAAVFWTWLWGPIGLLLATPLTVCLVVAGKYVPQLEFLNVLLGDEPVWDTSNRFYQRLLAMDEEEAAELVEEHLEAHSLVEVYDTIVLPALHLAERDRHRGVLDAEREKFIHQVVGSLIDDLEDTPLHPPAEPAEPASVSTRIMVAAGLTAAEPEPDPPPATPAARPGLSPRVLCLPARDEADELAARMLAQVMQKAGFSAKVASVESLASEMVDQVGAADAQVVCISALPPAAIAHSRYLCKRLRARFDKIKVLVGLWNTNGNLLRAQERLACSGTDKVVTLLSEALEEAGRFNFPEAVAAAIAPAAGSVTAKA